MGVRPRFSFGPSLFILQLNSSNRYMKTYCLKLTESTGFQIFFIGIILLAAVVVGMQTYPSMVERHGQILDFLDNLILWLFALEIVLKMIALGRNCLSFFKDGWNCFDFFIVAAGFSPFSGQSIIVMRLLRLLRVLRLIKAIPELKLLVNTLLRSIPSMGIIAVLLFLLFYIYAVMGVFMFGENDPVHFGSLHLGLLSLFRIVTLEDWTDIMYIAMYGCDNYGYGGIESLCVNPKANPVMGWVFFVSFVMIGTFILFNMLIGVILENMQTTKAVEKDEAEREFLASHPKDEVVKLVFKIKKDMEQLETHLHSLELIEDPEFKKRVAKSG